MMTANHDTAVHKRYLLKLAAESDPDVPVRDRWRLIIERKSGLADGHFTRASHSNLKHRDGTSCPHCVIGLPNRFMCIECAAGQVIEQYPHMDSNVCLDHRRWVGLNTSPDEQAIVGSAEVAAELEYRRLCAEGVMTAPLFLELSYMLREHFESHEHRAAERASDDVAIYPAMMQIAATLSELDFMRQLFDPTQTFADGYRMLLSSVERIVHEPSQDLAWAIWLYLRPTFVTVREFMLARRSGATVPYASAWAHDFPLPPDLCASFRQPVGPMEPLNRYLSVGRDSLASNDAFRATFVHISNGARRADGTVRGARGICSLGHRIIIGPATQNAVLAGKTGCCYCSNDDVKTGFNDLGTTHPLQASQLDANENGDITPQNIMAGSRTKVVWDCPTCGQKYTSEVDHRTRPGHGTNCSLCENREVRRGVNDITTTHPDKALDWDWDRNPDTPYEYTAGSGHRAWWVCRAGHPSYPQTILIHTGGPRGGSGRSCPKCGAIASGLHRRKPHGTDHK
ncbi:zinc-ribbon domain-containing protein [Salinibacterium sp. ZJ450]|uniref:zinc-ribbon domain-containing protein n=1 Tax=Salinibacterium sp. ZJ450 TaxID=2708338 RepID=UPI00142249C1|nr:zinc-ribbon domain-containing protein [Salinibacterium sp. ZJ450]